MCRGDAIGVGDMCGGGGQPSHSSAFDLAALFRIVTPPQKYLHHRNATHSLDISMDIFDSHDMHQVLLHSHASGSVTIFTCQADDSNLQ